MTSYATVAELKTYINDLTGGVQSSFSAGEDALLQTFLDEATAEIERQTGRTFTESAVGSRYYDKTSVTGRHLYLDADLLTLTLVRNGDGTLLDFGEVNLYPLNSRPYYRISLTSQSWTMTDDWLNSAEVQGTWGFSETPPADIKRATKRIAYFYWMKRTATGEATVLNETTTQDAAEYPADVMSVLRRYKRGRIL